MAKRFFRKKNKGEAERGPGFGGCCIVTRFVVCNHFGDKACFESEKLVLGGV
jgi:hypothetical protein